jgi:hypothetical protein
MKNQFNGDRNVEVSSVLSLCEPRCCPGVDVPACVNLIAAWVASVGGW